LLKSTIAGGSRHEPTPWCNPRPAPKLDNAADRGITTGARSSDLLRLGDKRGPQRSTPQDRSCPLRQAPAMGVVCARAILHSPSSSTAT
jgi:hypothetical protein